MIKIGDYKTLAIVAGLVTLTVLGVTYASALSQTSAKTSGQTSGSTIAQPAPGYPTIYPMPVPPTIQSSINIKQVIFSSIKINFADAANKAASSVSGGMGLGGRLTVSDQYLIYQFQVVDNNDMVYDITVDPGTGQVLYTSPGYPMSLGILGGLPYPEPMMYRYSTSSVPLPQLPSGDIQKMPSSTQSGTP
jgi:uncharacterized membrane protein YkoI